jgi:GT2 family glycosyltransferase
MDHDDCLEPHALHRFAQAALADGADLIYSDEAYTSEEIDDIHSLGIPLRTAFSYDYYLCHPYYVHLIAVKSSILRRVGGVDETMPVSQDVDLGFRLLERCKTITHVPEVLYRWRLHEASLSHQQSHRVQDATRGALQRHLSRVGVVATVHDIAHLNFRDIRFQPKGAPKVAILLTSFGARRSAEFRIQSIAKTVPKNLAETIVVDGQNHGRALTLAPARTGGRGLPAPAGRSLGGTAALLNEAVRRLDSSFTHYLFLDSDIEPISEGWLEHMLGLVTRGDVGIVGPLLFDPSCRIRHAGLLVGVAGSVSHAHLGADLRTGDHIRNYGRNGELLCTRDVAAVSARCMLVDGELFHNLGGFNDRFRDEFHDVDLCLRARAAGKKVLFDAHALLLDHADPDGPRKPSKKDLRLLRALHREALAQCDIYFHPLLSPHSPAFAYSPMARSREEVRFRTTEVVLPGSSGRPPVARVDPPESHERKRRVHLFEHCVPMSRIG